MASLKIRTLNVHGLGETFKRRKIFRSLHEESIDIAFLQETHFKKSKEKVYRSEWGGRIIFDHGEGNARGVAILFRRGLDLTMIKVTQSYIGRWLIVSIKLGEN